MLCIACVLAPSSTASRGKTAFDRGDVQAALDAFLEAHRVATLVNAPDASMAQLLNNLALCAQQLGRWKDATDFCERCLLVRRNFQPETHTECVKVVLCQCTARVHSGWVLSDLTSLFDVHTPCVFALYAMTGTFDAVIIWRTATITARSTQTRSEFTTTCCWCVPVLLFIACTVCMAVALGR